MSTQFRLVVNVALFLFFESKLTHSQLFPTNRDNNYDFYMRNTGQNINARVFPQSYNSDNKYPSYNPSGYIPPGYNPPGYIPPGYNPADPNFDRRQYPDPNSRFQYVSLSLLFVL